MEIRMYNDQLMRLERAFLDAGGLPPSRPHHKYVDCALFIATRYICIITLATRRLYFPSPWTENNTELSVL